MLTFKTRPLPYEMAHHPAAIGLDDRDPGATQNIVLQAVFSAFAQEDPQGRSAQDIKYWMQVMEESHVNLYHATTKDEKQGSPAWLAQLPDSFEHRKATLLISTLAVSLNEGHRLSGRPRHG